MLTHRQTDYANHTGLPAYPRSHQQDGVITVLLYLENLCEVGCECHTHQSASLCQYLRQIFAAKRKLAKIREDALPLHHLLDADHSPVPL